MEMQTSANKSLHPLIWVAGVALILFSAAGIGAFMGWIPTSMANPGETAVLGPQSANSVAPMPEKSHTEHVRHTAPIQMADGSSGRGKDVMTVVGVVGGAMAGNEVEKRSKSTRSYAWARYSPVAAPAVRSVVPRSVA